VFGINALVHRCHRHKERNVEDLLPERDRDQVRARMRAAWALTDPQLARQRLELLASELDRQLGDRRPKFPRRSGQPPAGRRERSSR
jgi:hypothetical protein